MKLATNAFARALAAGDKPHRENARSYAADRIAAPVAKLNRKT